MISKFRHNNSHSTSLKNSRKMHFLSISNQFQFHSIQFFGQESAFIVANYFSTHKKLIVDRKIFKIKILHGSLHKIQWKSSDPSKLT